MVIFGASENRAKKGLGRVKYFLSLSRLLLTENRAFNKAKDPERATKLCFL